MFPGINTKLSETVVASAATINSICDVLLITGSTAIATIVPKAGGFGSIIFLIPLDGSVGLLNTGNIAVAQTMIQNNVAVLVYSATKGKWYPHALA